MKIQILFLTLLFLAAFAVSGEDFRGNVTEMVEVGTEEESLFDISFGQIVLIRSDPAEPFIAGIELSPDIEASMTQFAGLFAFQFFRIAADAPQSGLQDLVGDRLETVPISETRRQYIVLPLTENSSDELAGDDTILPYVSFGENEWLAVQLIPLMKTFPDSIATLRFPIRVAPRLARVGGLWVELESMVPEEDEASYQLLLDGTKIEPETIIELAPGIYFLELRSSTFVNRSENVGIERGKLARIAVPLEKPKAEISFSVPSTAEILIDGNRVPIGTKSMTVEPGQHSFVVRLGDYSVSRQVFLNAEGTYEIGVELDFFVRSD